MTTALETLGQIAEMREVGRDAGPQAAQHAEGDAFGGLLDLFASLFGTQMTEAPDTAPTSPAHAGAEVAMAAHLRIEPDPALDRLNFTLRAAMATLTPAHAPQHEVTEHGQAATPAPAMPLEESPAETLAPMPAMPAPVAANALHAQQATEMTTPMPPAEATPDAESAPMPAALPAAPARPASAPLPAENPGPMPERPVAAARDDATQPTLTPSAAPGGDMDTGNGDTSQHSPRGGEGENPQRPMTPSPMAMDTNAETLSVGKASAPLQSQATTTATTPATAANPQPEIPARVTWLAQEGGGTARIALHPRDLGEVEVSVRVRGNTVDVQFVADDPTAQLAVSSARESLMEALGARDLRMESFQVRSADEASAERDFADSRQRDDATQRDTSSRDDANERRPETQGQALGVASGGPESTPMNTPATSPTAEPAGVDVHV